MKRQLLKQWQNRGKDARHFSFLGISMLLFWGLCACNDHIDTTEPSGITEDAGLLKSQLDRIRTRAADANVIILVTTADSVGFKVVHSSDVVVDWGDNHTELNTFSHTYTDNYPVHTIGFSGTQQAITEFVCNNQELIFMDVTRSTALEKLNCSFNRLTELEVRQNVNLKELNCESNRIASSGLNLSYNSKLVTLYCSNNGLLELDISQNENLEIIQCQLNQIDSLDLRNNNKLQILNIRKNNLVSIHLAGNKELTYFSCNDNQLSGLDLSANSKMTEVHCDNNKIVELNVSKNTNLHLLSCRNNQLDILLLPASSGLWNISLIGNPILNYPQRMEFLANSLPDRSGANFGMLMMQSPDIASEIRPLCQAKNWIVM